MNAMHAMVTVRDDAAGTVRVSCQYDISLACPFLKSVRQLTDARYIYRQTPNNFVLQDDSNGKFVD